MEYHVTDVTVFGAATYSFRKRSDAFQRYGKLLSCPNVLYAQIVEGSTVIGQYARLADNSQYIEMRP